MKQATGGAGDPIPAVLLGATPATKTQQHMININTGFRNGAACMGIKKHTHTLTYTCTHAFT